MEKKMKAIWSGSISFGLVSIPIKLYSAIRSESSQLSFTMLCPTCKNPIHYKRFCEHCKKEIPYSEILKGLKLENGKYFIVTPQKLKEFKPERTDSIDILNFVELDLVPIIYYDAHYYLAPEKKGEKPYALFLEALKKSGKAAIGKFVMKDKEYLCSINPYQDILLLTTLNYQYEIRDIDEIESQIKHSTITKAELDLALQLISRATKNKFDISGMRDEFSIKLLAAIKKGVKTKIGKIKKEKISSTKDQTLIKALKSSIKRPVAHSRRPAAMAKRRK